MDGGYITVVEQSTSERKKAGRNVPCHYTQYRINSPSSFLRPNFRNENFIPDYNHGRTVDLPEGNGTYTITNALYPLLFVEVEASSFDDGANVQLWSWERSDNRRWVFTGNGDGTYTITNVRSGKALDVSGASRKDGANVQQWDNSWEMHRSWWLEDMGDGSYSIKAVHSGRCLDIPGGRLVSGANVQQYRPNGTAAQRWVLKRVDSES